MNFEPQTVEPGSWKTWLREALELTVRKPVAFVVLALAFGAVDLVPEISGLLYLVFMPLFVGVGCRLAHQADKGAVSNLAITGLTVSAAARLVAFGAGMMTLIGLGMTLLWLLLVVLQVEPTPIELPPSDSLPIMLFGGGVALIFWIAAWQGLSLGVFWVVVPLIALENLPWAVVGDQTQRCFQKNGVVIRLAGAVGTLSFVAWILSFVVGTGLAAVFIYPFVCCLMYVSYRQIWWNRPNNKARRNINVGVGTTSSVRAQATH